MLYRHSNIVRIQYTYTPQILKHVSDTVWLLSFIFVDSGIEGNSMWDIILLHII